MLVIGIDAGTHTGVAVFKDKQLYELHSLNTYGAIEFLQKHQTLISVVVIEDSGKQSYIWGKNNKTNSALGRHARNIGSVDGKVKVLIEACEALKIKIHPIAPLQKGKKWTQEEFLHFFPHWKNRTNQHERDAVKCVWVLNYQYLS